MFYKTEHVGNLIFMTSESRSNYHNNNIIATMYTNRDGKTLQKRNVDNTIIISFKILLNSLVISKILK